MKTTVSIKGAEFFAFHGFYDEEQRAGNKFIVDITVSLKSFDSLDDNIEDTVNYEHLHQICKSVMSNTQRLLETVVLNIINELQTRFKNIESGSVKLEKISPQLGGKVGKAVIEMSF